jgi:hypothetical protein
MVFPQIQLFKLIKIDKIIWNKGYSSAIMDNYLIFKTTKNNIQIMRKRKAQMQSW